MARYAVTIDIAAPPQVVFDLWTNLDRMKEWVGGVTGVEDRAGPVTVAGSRYTVRFGGMRSPTEVVDVERPPSIRHEVRERHPSRPQSRDLRARR